MVVRRRGVGSHPSSVSREGAVTAGSPILKQADRRRNCATSVSLYSNALCRNHVCPPGTQMLVNFYCGAREANPGRTRIMASLRLSSSDTREEEMGVPVKAWGVRGLQRHLEKLVALKKFEFRSPYETGCVCPERARLALTGTAPTNPCERPIARDRQTPRRRRQVPRNSSREGERTR